LLLVPPAAVAVGGWAVLNNPKLATTTIGYRQLIVVGTHAGLSVLATTNNPLALTRIEDTLRLLLLLLLLLQGPTLM
jgi:hypothetical protein